MSKDIKEPKNETGRRPSKALAIPFIVIMAALTVVAFILPLRPEKSESEKRNLAKFPDFSVASLLDGSYFDGISLWFSDTFPGREGWLSLSASVDELHGLNDVTIYGDLPKSDDIPTVPSLTPRPTAATTATPVPTATPTPEPTPEPTEEVLGDVPDGDVETWGGVDAGDDAEIIFGSVLQVGDTAFSYFGFSQSGCDNYASIVNDFADAMAEKGVRVYSVLSPTSVGVMISPEYMEKLRCSDMTAALDYIHACMNGNVTPVDVIRPLIEHNAEYIFFRTDHHWTALGAYYAYEAFCAEAGLEAAPLSDFEVWDEGEFKGSFYYSCNQSSKLAVDNLIAYNPPGNYTVKITGTDGKTFPWKLLNDLSDAKASSKYLTFLSGDYPLIRIFNDDEPEGRSCVVVKDSFGNPFVPFLTQNYSSIYVVDYRYYTDMKLRYFVDYYGIDDVILAPNFTMAQSDGGCSLLRSLYK